MENTLVPHWINPWEDAVSVPIEELAECHAGLGQFYQTINQQDVSLSESIILTKEKVLEHWKSAGEHLDAYILPQPSGFHSIGIRYGENGQDYLSPLGDKECCLNFNEEI